MPSWNGMVASKPGHEALDLRVVEEDAVRLVAEQLPAPARGRLAGDEVGRDVHDVRLAPSAAAMRRSRSGPRSATSSEVMWNASPTAIGLPSRPTKPRAKSSACVTVHSDRAVAVHDDRPAAAHAGRASVGSPSRRSRSAGRVVGVRRAHDRRREAALAPGAHEHVLAGDLVPRVLPERVLERRRLRDEAASGRLLVGGGRADEHVLPACAARRAAVALDLLGGEGDPVHDRVERRGSRAPPRTAASSA